ncbi:proprotein convertase P-domain-containing protein [Streptomyces sp. AP-93]|uniref:proprotein convertase P-domain-containing protein n=1 Tax=Streptomyces sp. AP-93 TaxID=2929048 RepID=UPI001FAFCEDB|nr:proprotein convertase P-domain-containing protein [Streptomyces sp. AP-93]MCJ0869987.1 proprotein convertase P-domain-containing protein [Streptomyces sp. AP-93]
MRLRIPAVVVTAVTALALSALPAQAVSPDDFPPDPVGTVDPVDPSLYDAVAGGKAVRVNVVTESPADLSSTADAGETLHTFSEVPVQTLRVDAAGLDMLSGIPGILSVTEDIPVPPSLNETTSLIGADKTAQSGDDGSGSAIAILDTGVSQNHPFLGGRVTDQACFSTTDPSYGSTSLCPGGADEQAGLGSADSESGPCATMGTACSHGTHVAGIAAGNGKDLSGAPRAGVAPGADIVAIQVFSRFTSSTYCGAQPSCVMSFPSDQLAALEKVYALKQSGKPIVAANMSLGAGRFTAACETDLRKALIDSLYGAGVATVVASGNNSYTNAVNSPACVPSAVTVGATTDADQLASYSNRGPLVDLFAPGHGVISSVPGNTFGTKNGTSMAAPHVAGALAVLRKAAPQAPLGELVQALAATGKTITYTEGTTPRVQLDRAVAQVRANALPAPAAKPRPTMVTDTERVHLPGMGRGSVTRQLTSTVPGNAPSDLEVEYAVDGVGWNTLDVDLIDPNGKVYVLDTAAAAESSSGDELSTPQRAGPFWFSSVVDASGSPASGTWKLRLENGYTDYDSTMVAWTLGFPNGTAKAESITIPDTGAVVDSPAEVSGVGGLASRVAQVRIDLTHERPTDLVFRLVGPGGRTYDLANGFEPDDSGELQDLFAVDAGDSPADGNWTLKVQDNVTGATGSLEGWAITFPSLDNETVIAVPDNTSIQSTTEFWFARGSTPHNLRVYVDITHERHGDLKLDLVGPVGEVYPLKAPGTQPGGTLKQLFEVDAGGSRIYGRWTLKVTDTATGATGTLNNWSLAF